MRKMKKVTALLLAAMTAVSPILSAAPAYADDESDIDIIPAGESEVKIEAESQAEDVMPIPEVSKGKVFVVVEGKGGKLDLTIGEDKMTLKADEDGTVTSTDKDGNVSEVKVKDGYMLTLEEDEGSIVKTKAAADDGYNVATYSVTTDSGAEQELKESAGSVDYNITVKGNKYLKVGFAEYAESENDLEEIGQEESKTLDQLAEEAGLPMFSISDIEAEAWQTFCSLTGVDYDAFYEGLKQEYYTKLLQENGIRQSSEELVGLSGDTIAGVDKSKTKSITYSEGQWINYGTHGTAYRSADGLTGNATCIMPALGSTGGGTYTGYSIKNATLRHLMYTAPGAYGYNNSAAVREAYTNLTGSNDIMQHYVLWHLAMSFAYNTIVFNELGISDASWTSGAGPEWINRAQTLSLWIDNNMNSGLIESTPDDFECYIFNTSVGTQPIAVYYNYEPSNGSVKLVKKTAKGYEAMTKGNPCYDITGTTYELYNSANKNVGTLVCKADGTSNTIKDLPAGTYQAIETKAGQGYKLDEQPIIFVLKPNQDYTITAYDVPTNDPIGIELTKIDADTNKPVEKEGAEFTVKYYAVNIYEDTYNTVAELENATGGATRTWVMAYNKDKNTGKWGASFRTLIADRSDPVYYDENGRAAVPHGYITIEETKAPDGYSLIGKTIEGAEDRYKVDNGVLISKVYSNHIQAGNAAIAADHKISIGTKATDATTNSQQMANAERNVTVNDVVSYTGLTPGKTYTAVGRLVNEKEEAIKDKYGKEVTASKEFTPENTDGTVTVTFKFTLSDKQAEALAGKKIVAFEEVQDNGTTIASHTDINDEAQTIFVPKVKTEATDNGAHVAMGHKDQTIVDKVTCSNLIIGKKYKVSGTLMTVDDEGKETKLLIDGQEVTAETEEFTAEKTTEVKELTFTFDGSSLVMGKKVVAFETMTTEGIKIAVHADINDKNQTVWYPNIKTTAKDANSKTDQAIIDENGNIKIVDTIAYKDVEPGATYKLTGHVVDKSTGKAVTKDVSKEFTASESAGSETMSFTVKAEEVKGTELVVFEKMYLVKSTLSETVPSAPVAVHEDIRDEGQTVHLVNIKTTLTSSDGSKAVELKNPLNLVDTVEYEGLDTSKEYILIGTLMDKATGNALLDKDGKEVTVEKAFTPKAESGKEAVEFTVTLTAKQLKSLEGNSIVAFETMKQGDVIVTTHMDIDDEDQTINFPKIKTEATDNGAHVAMGHKDQTIVDKVTCNNLIVGKKYKVAGTLMTVDENGKETELLINGQKVTAETEEFTATKATEVKELTFKFDGSSLVMGKKVVAFETMTTEDIKIAVHADINDKNQTVWYPNIKTTAKDANTKTDMASIDENGNVKLVDTVSYKDVEPGATYKLTGYVVDKKTGKAVTQEVSKEFTAAETAGKETMSFTVKAADVAKSNALVVFEKMFLIKSTLSETVPTEPVAVHEDINDIDQTVLLPGIKTTLVADAKTKSKDVEIKNPITLTDIVEYDGLIAGKEYTLTGTITDKATGKALLDKDGKEVTAEHKFIPEAESGKEEIPFEIYLTDEQLEKLAGKSIVAFETLTQDDLTLVVHADINDEDQTIDFPKVKTEAKDVETQTQNSYADEDITITDKVTCENLIVGKEYTVSGTLTDKDTGKALLVDGKEVKSEPVTFKAEKTTEDKEITFKFNGVGLEGKTVVVFEDLYREKIKVAVHADINDKNQTVWIPKIGTQAKDADIKIQNQNAAKDQNLVDTVSYENFLPETSYTFVATLMDKGTGKAVMNDGKAVTAEMTFVTGKAEEGKHVVSGTADVTFTYDATGLANHTLVVFEKAYLTPDGYKPGDELPNAKIVATHEDIKDKEQSIYIPKIRTHAKDVESDSKTGLASGTQTVKDTVTYTGLLPEKEYVMTGKLVDKKTGEPIALASSDVKEATATETKTGETTDITPEDSSAAETEAKDSVVTTTSITFKTPALTEEQKAKGETTVSDSVELLFKVNASALVGKTVVAFETLTYEGKELAVHADINDEEQTVHYPKIGTVLVDKSDKDKLVLASKDAVVSDTLAYENLVPGEKYKAVATLWDQKTGKALLINDKPITAEKEFTASETGAGTVIIDIPFDASKLADTTLVCFEKVFTVSTNSEIAHHEDLKDEGQTVYIPKIGTKLVNKADKGKVVYAGQNAVVSDTVQYKNLIKGEKYKAVATLMDKETGKEIKVNGKPVTAEKEFTATAANGSVVVDITFDASALAGHSVVAFEKMYTAEGKVEFAVHEDINDKDQTVYIPKIGTVLKNKADGAKTITAANSVTLTDTIEYTNLVAGQKYKVTGRLMDKSTGKELTVNGKPVTAEKTFTAEKESGSVTIDFTFNSNGLGGKSVVAFEKMYTADGKVEVASHEDINDSNQTVKFTTPPTNGNKTSTTKNVQTGDDNMMMVAGIAGIAMLFVAVALVLFARKKRA